MSEKTVFKEAIETFGTENQVRQTFEEMGELIVALNKFIRYGDKFKDNVAEEISDVFIMLKQVIEMYELHDEVDIWYEHKMKRLKLLIANGNPNDETIDKIPFSVKNEESK